jgi:hypothetical protein
VNVVACALLVLLSEIGQFQTIGILREMLWFGLIFAPLWGACFGVLYPKFERDFYRNLNT